MNKRLEEFRKLEKNWDSYGGSPISENALEIADQLNTFFEAIGAAPQMFPSSDGGIGFEWENNRPFVTIEPTGYVELGIITDDMQDDKIILRTEPLLN